ncbi:hypothetical protein [Brevundimonas sp.]
MPSAQSLLIILTALVYFGAALVVAQIGRLLSPSYGTRMSANWFWRGVLWFGAVILFARGVTLLWPGQAFAVGKMSGIVLGTGLVILGFALWKLDDVMRENAPPPWSVQLMRLVALTGVDGLMTRTALTLPPASFGDLPPSDTPDPEQRPRLLMMGAALLVIVMVVAAIVLNSPAAAAV